MPWTTGSCRRWSAHRRPGPARPATSPRRAGVRGRAAEPASRSRTGRWPRCRRRRSDGRTASRAAAGHLGARRAAGRRARRGARTATDRSGSWPPTSRSCPLSSGRQLRMLTRSLGQATPTVLTGDLNMAPRRAERITGLRSLATGATFPAHRPDAQLDHLLAHRRRAGPRRRGRCCWRSPTTGRWSSTSAVV